MKELQLPLRDSSHIFQVVKFMESWSSPRSILGFDAFARDQVLPLGSNAARLIFFGH